MKQNNKIDITYESPIIELACAEIEKGFAASTDLEGDIEVMPWG